MFIAGLREELRHRVMDSGKTDPLEIFRFAQEMSRLRTKNVTRNRSPWSRPSRRSIWTTLTRTQSVDHRQRWRAVAFFVAPIDLTNKNVKGISTIVFGKVFDLNVFPNVTNDSVIVLVKVILTYKVSNDVSNDVNVENVENVENLFVFFDVVNVSKVFKASKVHKVYKVVKLMVVSKASMASMASTASMASMAFMVSNDFNDAKKVVDVLGVSVSVSVSSNLFNLKVISFKPVVKSWLNYEHDKSLRCWTFNYLINDRLLLLCCGDIDVNPGPQLQVRDQGHARDDLPDRGRGDLTANVMSTTTMTSDDVRLKKSDLQVVCMNVRGLSDTKKVRHLINNCYKLSKLATKSIFLFQETFVTKLDLVNYLWRGEYHLSPGTGNSYGPL